jgi:iron complex outermembrane receptor protein
MHYRNRVRAHRLAVSPAKFLTASSAIALVAALPTSALAQAQPQADAKPVSADQPADVAADDIVVIGLRAGLKASIDLKRDQSSIVEAVSAEDIGKLPDISIAEAIGRLPGLAAQRVAGRAQVISIRGLSPDFTTTLLNGRQQASSGDNRAVEFDQYPSELLASVVVYKTPDASIAGFGLSGTADLRTVRPLEFGKRAIAVNLRGELNTTKQLNADVGRAGFRGTASYIDQFADGKLGIALGYSHLDSPSQTQHFKAFFYANNDDQVPAAARASSPLLLQGLEAWSTSRSQIRDAAIGIVEWRPSSSIHSTLDVYYSSFRQNETTRGVQFFSSAFTPDGTTFPTLNVVTRNGQSFGQSGTETNIVPIIRNDYNTRRDNLFAIGLNTEIGSGSWKGTVDLGFSRNRRREQILETYAGFGISPNFVSGGGNNFDESRTPDTITFDIPQDGFPTLAGTLNYADASRVSLGDRAPWGGWGHDGAIRFPDVTEKIYTLDGKIDHDLDGGGLSGLFSHFEAGINYTRREKSRAVADNDLFLKNGRAQTLVPSQFLVSPTNLDFIGFGPILSVDLRTPGNLTNFYDISPILDSNNFRKNFSIEEDVVTGHVKADIKTTLFGLKLTGNIGVQGLYQRQSSTGFIASQDGGSAIVPVLTTAGASYFDVLPSLNLNYDLGSGSHLRFAAARENARPRVDDLRASLNAGFDQTGRQFNGDAGNPTLRPWRATALDLSYEWYIGPASYIAVAGFYKSLDSYIFERVTQFDFTGVPYPTNVTPQPGDRVVGNLRRPENGSGGNLYGVEVSGALELGRITPLLRGFGVVGSYSHTESGLNPTSGNDPVRIPGLSSDVYNITGYFESGGFEARISQRFRSGFKGEVVQLFASRGFSEILADRQIDAQLGYTFKGGALKGLGVQLQVYNLANSPYRTRLGLDGGGGTFTDGSTLPETFERYGRQVLFGFNYRF